MNILNCVATTSATALLAASLTIPATAQTAKAMLQDKNGKQVGTVDLSQTPAGSL